MVDNEADGSTEAALNDRFPAVQILPLAANLGYAGGAVVGMEEGLRLGGDSILIINNDCRVNDGFLAPLVEELENHPTTGAVGPILEARSEAGVDWFNSGQRFDLTRASVNDDGLTGSGEPPRSGREVVGYLCGACVLFRADALRDVGLFDPRLFLFGEEPDWTFRAQQKGWQSVAVAESQVDHIESTTTATVPGARRFFVARNQCWIVRRYGSRADRVRNALRTLLWRMPKAAAGHLGRSDRASAKGVTLGSIAGVFANCRPGSAPSDALRERRFELRPSD